MNKLSNAKRTQVAAALVEGNSIRATVRMTGVAKNTVTKLLVELGRGCDEYQRRALVGLKSRRISAMKSGRSFMPRRKTRTPR